MTRRSRSKSPSERPRTARQGPGRKPHRRRLRLELLEDRTLLSVRVAGVPEWISEGPYQTGGGYNETTGGQTENIRGAYGIFNPVIGAVETVAAHPSNADIVYVGAVNGGIWKTENATDLLPLWTPLTDQYESLSISAIEFDPTDPFGNTLVAAIGRTSSFGRNGGALNGLLKTTNGGRTWQQLGQSAFANANIGAVVPRGSTIIVGANAYAGNVANAGVWRSTDGGQNWTLVSGSDFDGDGTSDMIGAVTDLVGDPGNPNRLYAAVLPSITAATGAFRDVDGDGAPDTGGIWRSDDAGVTWTNVTSPALNAVINQAPINLGASWAGTNNIEIAVHSSTTATGTRNAVYAAVMFVGSIGPGNLPGTTTLNPNAGGGIFRSPDFGGTWVQMDTPQTNEGGSTWGLQPRSKPGGQGATHFSIIADPNDPWIVYVGGDRQPSPFPNSIGALDFTGRLFRGDIRLAAGSQWTPLTHNGTTSNSAPHADSRDMAFDVNGALIEVDDGGIYRRTSPGDSTGDWFSLIGYGLQVTEFHDIAFDSNSLTLIGGAQDTGVHDQGFQDTLIQDRFVWNAATVADGGDVAIDNQSRAGRNESVRFYSTQNIGRFTWRVYDQIGNFVGLPVENIISTEAGSPLFVRSTGHGLQNGDVVVIYNNPLISQPDPPGPRNAYQITGVTADTFQLVGITGTGRTTAGGGQIEVRPALRLTTAGTPLVGNAPFVTQTEVNPIVGTWLAFGGGGIDVDGDGVNDGSPIYASFNRGSTIAQLNFSYDSDGDGVADINPVAPGAVNALAFGGQKNGEPAPEILYAAVGGQLYVRDAIGRPLRATLGLPPSPLGVLPGNIVDVAMDPTDWGTVYVATSGSVYQGTNVDLLFNNADDNGNFLIDDSNEMTWTEITGRDLDGDGFFDVQLLDRNLHTIQAVKGPLTDAVLVGGDTGVWRTILNNAGVWSEYGAGLPNAPVWDMDYDATADVLAVGTLGRGAWTIPDVTATVFTRPVLEVNGTDAVDIITLRAYEDNPLLFHVALLNDTLERHTFQQSVFEEIRISGLGRADFIGVNFSNGKPYSGTLHIDAGSSDGDFLILTGSAMRDRATLLGDTVSFDAGTLFVSDPDLTFEGVENLQFFMGDGGDIVNIDAVSNGTRVEVRGDGGADVVRVGGGDYFGNIKEEVSVEGNAGFDILQISDFRDTSGKSGSGRGSSTNYDTYTLKAGSFEKSERTDNVFGGFTLHAPMLTFSSMSDVIVSTSGVTPAGDTSDGTTVINVEGLDPGSVLRVNTGLGNNTVNFDTSATNVDVTLFGNDGNDTFNITRTGMGASITVNGNDGDDTILISPVEMDLDLIRGAVSVVGGGGIDAVVLDDRNFRMDGQPGTLPYLLYPGLVQKIYLPQPDISFGKFPGLGYSEVEDLTLQAAGGDNAIVVYGMTPGTDLQLFGNGGADEFHLMAPPTSLITVDGGPPQSPFISQDDSLTVAIDNEWSDFAIRDGGAGYTSLSHESNPSAGVQFTDVRSVMVDGSAIDVDSNWTVEASALDAGGDDPRVELLTGTARTIVSDHTLEGPATQATLVVRNLAGGITQHFVFGAPAELTATLRDHQNQVQGAFTELVGRTASGSIAHIIKDEGVDEVFVVAPQTDVTLTLESSDAQITGSGSHLSVAGTGLSQISIPPAPDGRLRVLPVADMTVDIFETLFPNFEFSPIYDLDVSPLGRFHVFPVNSTQFSDNLPFEDAVLKANAAPTDGRAVVFFSIPIGNPGFRDVDSALGGDPEKDAFIITPAFSASLFRDGIIINGASQQFYTGDTNPFGPEIVLDGAFTMNNALRIVSDNNIIHGLGIHSFDEAAVVVGGSENTVSGNYIGVDATGTLERGNGGAGVFVAGGADNHPTSGNVIAGNLISGNEAAGVAISGDFAVLNVISDNRIGTDRTGSYAVGNAIGVTIDSAQGNSVEDNLIAGNEVGLRLTTFASGNLIRNNQIGSTADGGPGNSGDGILLVAGIGNAIWDNEISRNGGNGITVLGDWGNSLQRNSIHANAGLGIDLGDDGVTANDLQDSDAGPNDLQNHPELRDAQSGEFTRVAGFIDTTPSTSIVLEFFASPSVDESGFGEGERFLGWKYITTDADGHASFEYLLDAPTVLGEWITATATGETSSTSEFSAGVATEEAAFRVVSNTNDGGPGSLRDAIERANQIDGSNPVDILFHIAETDPNFIDTDAHLPDDGSDLEPDVFVITPQTALPALTRGNIFINGQSQQNSTGDTNPFGPEIVLSGSGIGGRPDGLHLDSDGNRVHGLVIQEFAGNGILVTGDENRITGSYLGTDATGTQVARNHEGVYVSNAAGIVIGGADAGDRNVIGGNAVNIRLIGEQTTGTVVQGNYIGVDATGASAVTNGWGTGINNDGILIQSGAHHNEIRGNVIGGHWEQGIWITGGAGGNTIEGNRVGTNAAGDASIGNLRGILVVDAPDHTIRENLVSGNYFGVEVRGAPSTGLVIEGNRIGTDATATRALTGQNTGIRLQDAVLGARIGGTAADQRNVISGNGTGIHLLSGSDGAVIQNNYIGTDLLGEAVIGNSAGIYVVDSSNVLIGGSEADAGNLVSGNTNAIRIDGSASTNNRVQGNFVGTNAGGTDVLPNQAGVSVGYGAALNIIGTDGDGIADDREGNLLSGNPLGEVYLHNNASDNVVAGNLIGTDWTGTRALPSAGGVAVLYQGSRNRIGTNADGISDELERNVIVSGIGLALDPRVPSVMEDNVIKGNYLGTDVTGSIAFGVGHAGIRLGFSRAADSAETEGPVRTVIGGTTDVERNLIGGFTQHGIAANRAVGTVIQGNYIGVGSDGVTALGNFDGVLLTGTTETRIGGTAEGAGNVISGNRRYGIGVSVSSFTTMQGNLIGTDVSGTVAVGNALAGVELTGYATDTLIGGSEAGAGNLISGNPYGVRVSGAGATERTRIEGNRIGTRADGTTALGNGTGIQVLATGGSIVRETAVGGGAPGAGNVISGNTNHGIHVVGTGPDEAVRIAGNWIGVDPNGTNAVPNATGVLLEDASGVLIGGTEPGARNVISGNEGPGISSVGGSGHTMWGNYIGTTTDGSQALGNRTGIHLLDSHHNQVGGSSPEVRNVVSGNAVTGIQLRGASSDNTIQGNYIGTEVSGTSDLGNGVAGIDIIVDSSRNIIGTDGDGLSDGSEGNLIAGNNGYGVQLRGLNLGTPADNVIAANWIGVNAGGNDALGNRGGILLWGTSGTRIGTNADGLSDLAERNVIAANGNPDAEILNGIIGDFGIYMTENEDVVIAGNYVGVGADGLTPLGNVADGITLLESPRTVVGGDIAPARNVIADNGRYGITLRRSSDSRISGNFIGIAADGSTAAGNFGTGVYIADAVNVVVGGPTDAARNIISASTAGYGVAVQRGTGNRIEGNYIGTDVTGALDLGNEKSGVLLEDTTNNTLRGNVISGNEEHGISIVEGSGHTILGNYLGTTADGMSPLGNALAGVHIEGSRNNLIGGSAPGEGNLISGNTGNGVTVAGDLSTGNTIRGNSIYANGGLGIDLGGEGVTPLDIRDLDEGPNDLQNMPVIGLAVTGPTTRVAGVLHSTPTASFTLDFYAVSELDPTGHGEGQRWLGSGIVTTDADGNGSYDLVLDAATENGERITATATNAGGSTSEFSKWRVDDVPANTLVVTNTKDSGIGSLRQAITAANQMGGSDPAHIWFRIPTTDTGYTDTDSHLPDGDSLEDVFVITPQSPLPAVTRGNVSIDGNTQYFLGGNSNPFGPEIVLNGSAIPFSASGLHLHSDGNRVVGLVIQEFAGSGVSITGDQNHIYGNYIGMTATGTEAAGNRGSGIYLEDASSNQIGAAGYIRTQTRDFPAQNVIGGSQANIEIRGAGAADNVIQGNYIGVNVAGDEGLDREASERAILIADGAHRIVIGGANPGEGNLIAGHSGNAIEIFGAGENTIAGNKIGTNAAGDARIGKVQSYANFRGVRLVDSPDNEIVGNLISGNMDGILVEGPDSSGLVIRGNTIGTNLEGTGALPNAWYGINIIGAPGALIGGLAEADRNLISGNQTGIRLAAGSDHRVWGNYIGTNRSGSVAIGNEELGVYVADSTNVLIGGAEEGAGNLISGNAWGVQVLGAASGVRIQGNRIGTTADGLEARGNSIGVSIRAGGNYVGTDGDGLDDDREGNLISGNTYLAVEFALAGTEDNVLAGNWIGTDVIGLTSLANARGVMINADAGYNRIGTNADGMSDELERNVISGNVSFAIHIENSFENEVAGNFIGPDASGNGGPGNGSGVTISNSSNNRIGGTDPAARNVISGNAGYGIAVQRGTGNRIEGNFIGTDSTGTLDRGNANSGVLLQDTTDNRLRANVISGNDVNGVFVHGSAPSTDMTNFIDANWIGTDATGTHDLGNTLMGVRIQQGTGPVVRENVVSGNDNSNIHVDATASGVLIEGNFIGTDETGNAALLNAQGQPAVGVTLVGRENVVRRNVISANRVDGVNLDGLNVPDGRGSGNVLEENLIGVGLDGVTPLGNGRYGVRIWRGASDNRIGTTGTDPATDALGNVIAHNAEQGVLILDDASLGNAIRGNAIHSNGKLGIDLGGDGVTTNDPHTAFDADSGPNQLQNFPVIRQARAGGQVIRIAGQLYSTQETHFLVDFYANTQPDDPDGHGEGERWLGSIRVRTREDGVAAIRFDVPLDQAAVGEYITATATRLVDDDSDPATEPVARDTSEFSLAVQIAGANRGGGGNGNGGARPVLAESYGPGAMTGESLTVSAVEPILSEAIDRWYAPGIDEARFAGVDVRVADLPGTTLGLAVGNTIRLDVDAAGWGWFIDATPRDDREFVRPGSQGEQDRMDLLTVVMHELGHLLGHEHEEDGVMLETLAAGVRRAETAGEHDRRSLMRDRYFADQAAGEDGPLWDEDWLEMIGHGLLSASIDRVRPDGTDLRRPPRGGQRELAPDWNLMWNPSGP